MPTPIDSLFNSTSADISPKGSKYWNQEVFERAYCRGNGAFDAVCQRLRRGFSVLVYLPGNCMVSAAEVVKRDLKSQAKDWTELGKPMEDAKTVADMWQKSTSMFTMIQDWFKSAQNSRPHVIFHNLDLLSNNSGGLDPNDAAKTALFYLVDSVRSGVVLGLSDRDAGELPVSIRRAFDEEIWLDELPVERFSAIIPLKLGQRLEQDRQVPDGATWLIASRLRWTDPIRAVNIMDYVADKVDKGDLEKILQKIMEVTQTVEFLAPSKIENIKTDLRGAPTGFEPETIRLLTANIITPFQHWARFTGEQEACQRELRKLPPGLILYGPPGTGKTRLARWIAKSINLPVRLVSAADLKRADWGLTEKLIKDLFRSARRAAPCVIVLDDADDLLPDRASSEGSIAGAERGIVNAFLQELEGWHGRLEGVLVILTTNRYKDLDAAAKQRLHIQLRIPYPLNKSQVEQVVLAVADSYSMCLSDDVRELLVDSFMKPIKHTPDSIDTEPARRVADRNLFSPREISAAMRLLINSSGKDPDIMDVKGMINYLERQAIDITG